MVLLITTNDRRGPCAEAIRKTTGEVVRVAANKDTVRSELRAHQFSVIVIEALLWDSDGFSEIISASGGAAALLVANLAICGCERIASETSATLRRHQAELRHAREEVERQLRTKLNEAVTGILLSAELALTTPELPAPAETKIRAVYDLAKGIREKLGLTA